MRVRFNLSERAGVTVKLQRTVVVQGKKHWRTVKTLRRAGRPGANSLRIGKRALGRGSYRALVRAVDAAGNRSRLKRVRVRR